MSTILRQIFLKSCEQSFAKIILNNKIIVYCFSNKIVEIFYKLLNKYFLLFKNIDFAKLLKKN